MIKSLKEPKGMINFFKTLFYLVKEAAKAFFRDNGVKLSAALSYYTIFAIGPLLVIVLSLSGILLGRDAVQGELYGQIRGLIGSNAAAQVELVIKNIQHTNESFIGAILGFIVLAIGATGIFAEIQDSINTIWCLKSKPKRELTKLLINRLVSFSLIVSVGFLLIVSLVVNALMDLLKGRLVELFQGTMVFVFYVLNLALIWGVVGVLFAIIFKVLPDGKIRWKDALTGALFTSFLFIIGKAAIGFYLGNSKMSITFGAAASVIIILTWVYYNSIILYFGAEFTKIYAQEYGGGITPDDNAVFVVKQEAREIEVKRRRPKPVKKIRGAKK
jgi:membrane protein